MNYVYTTQQMCKIVLFANIACSQLSASFFNYSKSTITIQLSTSPTDKRGVGQFTLNPGAYYSPEKIDDYEKTRYIRILKGTKNKYTGVLVGKMPFDARKKLDVYVNQSTKDPTSHEYISELFLVTTMTTRNPIISKNYWFNNNASDSPQLHTLNVPKTFFDAGNISTIDNQTSNNYTIQASVQLPVVYANSKNQLLANNKPIKFPEMFGTGTSSSTQQQITLTPDDPTTVPTITLAFDTQTNIMTIKSAVQTVPYSNLTLNIGTLNKYVPIENAANGIANWDFGLTINADNTLEVKTISVYETYVNRANNISQHKYSILPQSATKSDWNGSTETKTTSMNIGGMCQTGLISGIKNAGQPFCSSQ